MLDRARNAKRDVELGRDDFTSLADLVASTVNEFRTTNHPYIFKKWDAVGFDVCVFPILIENDFVGTVIAAGFFNDSTGAQRVSEVRERLAAFGCSACREKR